MTHKMCKRFVGRRVPPRHCRHQGRTSLPTSHTTRRGDAPERVRRPARRTRHDRALGHRPSRPRRATARRRRTRRRAPGTEPGDATADRRPTRRVRRRERTAEPGPAGRAARGRSGASAGSADRPPCPPGAVHARWHARGRACAGPAGATGRRRTGRLSTARESGGARWRPDSDLRPGRAVAPRERGAGPPTAISAASGARRRPTDGDSAISGARRRPTEANCAVSSAVRRPPDDGSVRHDGEVADHRQARGRPRSLRSAERARRPDGWRATDISWVAGPRLAPRAARPTRCRSGRRRVARSVHAVSSTPPRTTRTQTWQEPSASCRQPSSSPPTRYRPDRPRPPGADW